MGFRFQRRIRIAPGLSLNVSKSGLGISAGPRGAKVGIGPRGFHGSVGIPGTGLSFREEARWKSAKRPAATRTHHGSSEAVLVVRDDGDVRLVDKSGNAVPASLAKRIREQNAELIRDFFERTSEKWNAGIDAILSVHLDTPNPAAGLAYEIERYGEPRPAPFEPRALGWLGKIWRPTRERIERENEVGLKAHAVALAEWEANKEHFDVTARARQQDYEQRRYTDVGAMERVLEERLSSIDWPRTTDVSYQLRANGNELWLDVDLPEIEDIPTQLMTPAARSLKLNIKRKSETQVRRDYMQHVHGVLFRIVGEAFLWLPSVKLAVASGYSQRADRTTGHVRDEYLVSARIDRSEWLRLNFENLAALDVVECFERFDTRRKITKTGVFSPIVPHSDGKA